MGLGRPRAGRARGQALRKKGAAAAFLKDPCAGEMGVCGARVTGGDISGQEGG